MSEALGIIDGLRRFLIEDLDIDADEVESGEAPLFSTGIIDSFALVSVLTWIESNHDVRVGPTDVNLANFDTLDRMATYIESRRAG